jgi:tRNA nucleotidyltransferase (CCA-adding enzyme)
MATMTDLLPDDLAKALTQTPELRETYLVGGCVRDWLSGRPCKDFDVEVFGVSYDQLVDLLSPWGKTDLVGRSFGVVKLTTPRGAIYDFTVPRRDSKVAAGHSGFKITFDPAITRREAAARRDFTINSLMFDPRRGELLDFFGGAEDLRNRVLRHTSPAFVEDPLRVLRGMQFAARFDLRGAPETIALSRRMKPDYRELAVERVREEWFKWAAKSVVPSAGLRFLQETEWLEHFPEVHALLGTPQDPDWHPEGDVLVHTGHCCDAMATLPEWKAADAESRIVYMLAILAHDFGKPATTHEAERHDGKRIVSPGHEETGGPLAVAFLERINAPAAIRDRVVPLVVNHLSHLQPVTERSVRRLAKRLEPENIRGLSLIITADHFGRPPRPRIVPESLKTLQAMAADLEVQSAAPKPILMGRHLIELGLQPGRDFGVLLDAAYDAQLEGRFFDLTRALLWLNEEGGLGLPIEARNALTARLNKETMG